MALGYRTPRHPAGTRSRRLVRDSLPCPPSYASGPARAIGVRRGSAAVNRGEPLTDLVSLGCAELGVHEQHLLLVMPGLERVASAPDLPRGLGRCDDTEQAARAAMPGRWRVTSSARPRAVPAGSRPAVLMPGRAPGGALASGTAGLRHARRSARADWRAAGRPCCRATSCRCQRSAARRAGRPRPRARRAGAGWPRRAGRRPSRSSARGGRGRAAAARAGRRRPC
jgi:hypothetical protein